MESSEDEFNSSSIPSVGSRHTLSTSKRIKIRDKILATGGMRKEPRIRTRESNPSSCPHSEVSLQTSSTLTITDNSQTVLSKRLSRDSIDKEQSFCSYSRKGCCETRPAKNPPTTTQRAVKTVTKCAKLAYRKVPSLCSQLGGATSTAKSNELSADVLECMNCEPPAPADDKKLNRQLRKDKLREMKKRREKRIGASVASLENSDSIISTRSITSSSRGREISAAIAAAKKKKKMECVFSTSSLSGDTVYQAWKGRRRCHSKRKRAKHTKKK
uniref:Uncharacterized protein n=1 Tax=Ciona savignyi TaxID=51511 RepID=H2ZK17_CIOSA